ncbi:MAG: orotidine-5'-phosphate decarboxylase [Chloroflexota bacterium]|nr:orotidine-5'-phosphate decarboxylase [Chloroflexota bacterium]
MAVLVTGAEAPRFSRAPADDRDEYLDTLGARIGRTGSALCLGLDPDPDALPDGFPPNVEGIERFVRLLLDVAAPFASAVKPNLAFYEALGSAGIAALERLRSRVPPDLPLIADAKRADIRSTSARHAAALYDALDADAVTANPYLGAEAIEPLLARRDRFVYVLCRTSNPGAGELQDLAVAPDREQGWPEEPLHVRVARRAATWQVEFGTVGLVVGATAPGDLGRVRDAAPDLPFLVPGVGAQGGDVASVIEQGQASSGRAARLPGGALLVNVSRGIAAATVGRNDPEAAVAAAAAEWSRRLQVLG